MAYVFFLRGGGSTGAIYHFGSDQAINPIVYYNGSSDLVYDSTNASYKVYAFEPLTTVNKERLDGLKIAKESSVSEVRTRISTAEQKITDEAIVSTVTKSTTYKDALNGKVSTSSIISCINQTAEAIKINASKINLTGAVTISALATDTVNKLNNAYNTANSVNNTVNSNKANWDRGLTAYNWTSANGTKANNLYNMVTKWTNNAVSTSTYIQGGWIATGTLTADKIATSAIAIFKDNGGYNLLKNGSAKNGTAYWSERQYNLAGNDLTKSFVVTNTMWTNYENAFQLRIQHMTGGEYGFNQWFDTVIGKKYVFTCYLAGHRCYKSVIIRGTTSSETAWLANASYGDIYGGTNLDNWVKVCIPFIAQRTRTSVEINITASNTTDAYLWAKELMISEGDSWKPYSPNPNEIYTGYTYIDQNGVTIKNGALKILNNAGTTVLSGDTSGNLKLAGNITSSATISGGVLKSNNGDMYFNLNDGYILLYNNGTKIGQTNKNSLSGTSIFGITNGAEYSNYSCLAAKTSSDSNIYTAMVTVAGKDLTSSIKKGINLGHDVNSNNWDFNMGTSSVLKWRQSSSNYDSFITEGSEGMLRIYGDNGVYLGYREAANNYYVIAVRENGSHTYPKSLSIFEESTSSTDNNGYSIEVHAPIKMNGQAINECSNIKTLGLEIVEPVAFYGDEVTQTRTLKVTKSTQDIIEFIGTATIINGETVVNLPNDVVFKNYIVMLSPIGLNKKVFVTEKNDDCFKITGDDCDVDYVIKFETVSYTSYMKKSFNDIDNVCEVVRSEEDLPKPVILV